MVSFDAWTEGPSETLDLPYSSKNIFFQVKSGTCQGIPVKERKGHPYLFGLDR